MYVVEKEVYRRIFCANVGGVGVGGGNIIHTDMTFMAPIDQKEIVSAQQIDRLAFEKRLFQTLCQLIDFTVEVFAHFYHGAQHFFSIRGVEMRTQKRTFEKKDFRQLYKACGALRLFSLYAK